MISSQEVIERSVYSALLKTLLSTGYSLDPDNYFPISQDSSARFKSDKELIEKEKGFFIHLNGVGNSQSRGMKDFPSITIEANGFMPGDIGLPKSIIEKVEDSYFVSEFPYEAIDQFIDIHLIANNISNMRLLHTLLFSSIPQRGYIKPYNLPEIPFDGNIFIEISNFYDMPNTDKGIMEKVYQFTIKDSLLDYPKDLPDPIVPINAMELLLGLDSDILTGNNRKHITDSELQHIKGKINISNKLEIVK